MPSSSQTSPNADVYREHLSCRVCVLATSCPPPKSTPMRAQTHEQDIQCPPLVARAADCLACIPTPSCEDATCTDGITEICTDRCVVVACDDPTHHVTDGVSMCEAGDDCPDLHPVFPCCDEPFPLDSDQHLATLKELDAILCQCGLEPLHHDAHHDDFVQLSNDWSQSYTHSDSANLHPSSNFDHFTPPFPIHSTHPQPSSAMPMLSAEGHTFSSVLPQNPAVHSLTPSLNQMPTPHRCMWSHCTRAFAEFSALVGHVNVDHLRSPEASTPSQGIPTPSSTPLLGLATQNRSDAHHSVYVGENSTSQHMGATFDHTNSVSSHQWPLLPLPYINTELSSSAKSLPTSLSGAPSSSLLMSPASEAASSFLSDASSSFSFANHVGHTLGSEPPSDSSYRCCWQDCTLSFGSIADLDGHVDEAHIGSGKAHYDCYWANCERHGTAGFASRQKVKRHVQSHTGHRPHTCPECGQSFSEAATLQQHQRRHSKEKPHKCDFPGCDKAFTVAGALTIHKRTHSGDKPFQCAYCDKKFSESSNLSKHMRTHTGARPYACFQCDKTFARPDQLNRHVGSVHKKGSSPGLRETAATVAG